MDEVVKTANPKTKPAATPGAAAFDLPKFELPNFEIPKMEIPTAFREMAEKSVSQAKETYEKMKSAVKKRRPACSKAPTRRPPRRRRLRPGR